MFNEAEIVKFLRKNASRADYILAGKKRIFICVFAHVIGSVFLDDAKNMA